jgi:magnesium chelatase family protein
MHVSVDEVPYEEMTAQRGGEETSAEVRQRVNAARKIQQQRYTGSGIFCNASLSGAMTEQYCVLDKESPRCSAPPTRPWASRRAA